MYVLFIPSFPNNRFHLGNIRTTKRKNKRRKGERERRSRSLVSSLQTLCIVYSLKLCGNFVTFFFVFYILYNRKRALTRALEQTLITFVSFLFLSFLFFLEHKQVSQSRRLATAATWVTLSFVRFTLQRNTWRARAGSFITSRGRFFVFRCFRVEISPYFFELPCWRSQKWFGFCLRCREKCVLLRTFVPV